MANKTINKVIFGGSVLLDLSADTATEATVLSGATFHDKAGATKTGKCTYDSDTSEDTAAVAELLVNKTAHARGAKLTGTMPNNGSVHLVVNTKEEAVKIPQGYHDGAGTVKINSDDASKLIAPNIRQGIEILGVIGSMSGADSIKTQSKKVTPTKQSQIVTPDPGYNYLTQVTVAAIPYVAQDNAAGGQTVTIG